MRILLLRHGETAGNLEKRYVGRARRGAYGGSHTGAAADLSEAEAASLRASGGPVAAVYASPMRRCLETAALVFPEKDFSGVPRPSRCPAFRNVTLAGLSTKITGSFPGMRITSGSSIPAEQTGSREARLWRSSRAGAQMPSGRRYVPLWEKQTARRCS